MFVCWFKRLRRDVVAEVRAVEMDFLGSATVSVAVLGVSPRTFPDNIQPNYSGVTPEFARETRALPFAAMSRRKCAPSK
jgi:hypothetical protein